MRIGGQSATMKSAQTGATLEELTNEIWEKPAYESGLTLRWYNLGKKPIDQFSAGDLRFMISENCFLEYMLPRAMEMLRNKPLICGYIYEGDLLRYVIDCEWVYNEKDKKLNAELVQLCIEAIKQLEREEFEADDWENEPEEYGFTKAHAEGSIRSRYQKLKTSEPYRDFAKFANVKRKYPLIFGRNSRYQGHCNIGS